MRIVVSVRWRTQSPVVFEDDLKSSNPYDFQRWQQRPWLEKFAEVILIPIKSQL
jgi:cardiolipin synthase